MRNRVLILGNFSTLNNELCGQSIKTRNIYALLKEKSEQIGNINMFDTDQLRPSIKMILQMILEIWRCEKLVYVPAQNNLKYLFPFIYFICKIRGIEILYFVVGGWLSEFLQTKKLHSYLLSKIRIILPESDQLSNKLKDRYNFRNVNTFPNFRIHNFIPPDHSNGNSFNIVFMARVSRMKGLDTIFMLADHIASLKLMGHPISIDFYGLLDGDEEYFKRNIGKYSFTNYKGILEPEQIYATLSNYDLMVLPTRYYTEGFPGSILDAYISGIPVIVTRWKYAAEFIDEGETGYIVPFENGEKEFINSVIKIYQDHDLLDSMKRKAFEKSKIYSSEHAWEILKRFLVN